MRGDAEVVLRATVPAIAAPGMCAGLGIRGTVRLRHAWGLDRAETTWCATRWPIPAIASSKNSRQVSPFTFAPDSSCLGLRDGDVLASCSRAATRLRTPTNGHGTSLDPVAIFISVAQVTCGRRRHDRTCGPCRARRVTRHGANSQKPTAAQPNWLPAGVMICTVTSRLLVRGTIAGFRRVGQGFNSCVPIWTAGRRTFSPAERRVWQISSVAGDTRAILESHGGCRKTRASKASSDASTKSDHGPADTDPTSISGADTITLVTRLTRMSYLPGPYPVAHVHASADALPIRSLDRQMIEL